MTFVEKGPGNTAANALGGMSVNKKTEELGKLDSLT